jgi:ATP-dependent DNA helicase RecQ
VLEISFDILFKYLKVVDEDVYGSSGSPKDSVKHLQGAVRLIRRALTDDNATLAMLNAFCRAYLGTNNNDTLELELETSFNEGYRLFYSATNDKILFYKTFEELIQRLHDIHIEQSIIQKMDLWRVQSELSIHTKWTSNFAERYIK